MDLQKSCIVSPFGEFQLDRLPLVNASSKQDSLRAWDAADELLLQYLFDHQLPKKNSRIIILNDTFGALACSLNESNIISWSDSFISHSATDHNQTINHQKNTTTMLPSNLNPEGPFDLVLIKIPKTLALLEHQLLELKPLITEHTQIISAGMVKYLQNSHLQLFKKIVGTTSTSLAVKKARLYISQRHHNDELNRSPYPRHYFLEELGLNISDHANVFSREKLDIGTRFLLQQLSKLPAATTILDLGCGNGILGIIAKRQQPNSEVYFVDESYMAVASAKKNYMDNIEKELSVSSEKFIVSDCLKQTTLKNIDLILCNPPFHHNNTVGDHTAWRMFKHSHQRLVKHGCFWVIGNRHLNYHLKLKRLFGNCRVIASNKKFVVLEAKKT
jgi:16S rRNA G1207 methylase RsmC